MKFKIAVIDDNPDDIFTIRRMLLKTWPDFNVIDFTNPSIALNELSGNSVDCIILDFNFPEMNGLEFIKAFKKTIHDTPIILMTGQGNEKIAVDALKNGAFDYLLKDELTEKMLYQSILNAIEARDHQRSRKSNHEFIKKLVDIIPVPLFYNDRNGVFVGCNQAFEIFVGKSRAEVIGSTPDELSNHENAAIYAEMARTLLEHPGKLTREIRFVDRNQQTRYVVVQMIAYNNSNGEVEGIISTINDITESKLREVELSEKSFIDSLTGISNRRYFDENIEMIWNRCIRENEPLSLIMADIDLFKNYNDYYGHQAGDECLKKIAHGIQTALLRPSDIAIRYGGEEFLVALPYTDAKGALEVAQRIRQNILDMRIRHEDSSVAKVVTISQGVVEMSDFKKSVYDGLMLADHLLYQAKKNGRNRIEL